MHRGDALVEESASVARGIDRRTIAKGVAWTVPVVIVATAAPAVAASGVTATFGSRTSQGKRNLELTVTNGRTSGVSVQLLTLYKGNSTTTLIKSTTTVVQPGATAIPVLAVGNGTGDNGTYTLSYRIATDAAASQSVTLT